MTVLPPTRNMSEILDGGKVCNFPQISNKRVPSSVQKSQKQAPPRPKHGSPPPVRFPIRTPWAPKHPLHPPSSVRRRPPPHPPPSSSTMPELIPRRHCPLQEIDLSHPRLRTGILASRPLASSPPSSTLPVSLLHPSRPPYPAATVYPPRSASTPPTTIATAAPSNSQQMPTRRRTRGGTLSYLLNLFIAARK